LPGYATCALAPSQRKAQANLRKAQVAEAWLGVILGFIWLLAVARES